MTCPTKLSEITKGYRAGNPLSRMLSHEGKSVRRPGRSAEVHREEAFGMPTQPIMTLAVVDLPFASKSSFAPQIAVPSVSHKPTRALAPDRLKETNVDIHKSLNEEMLNKVPLITLAFWVIKIMATTVGETAADFLIFNVGLGLVLTSLIMGALLIAVLVYQLKLREYVPTSYWLVVVLVSIVGTLVSDYMVDDLGITLVTTTVAFAICLAVTFIAWYASEKTLSIHSIFTTKRELFYWAAILFTFALGTAAGDLIAEGVGLGYGTSAVIFGALIGLVYLGYRLGMDAVLAFWVAYILTRPFGASMGDLLSQPTSNGGLGLGTTGTSALFLVTIAVLVTYLTFTRKDKIEARRASQATV